MNGVNLNAFQFDFDLTWMAFFQNANGQTYTRYGGHEDAGPETHMTKASLIETMQRVLKLHAAKDVKPWSKYEPEPKQTFTPEQIPPMKKMLGKRKESCIHCHDVKNATLKDLASRNELTKYMVYGYPSPAQLGIVLDADNQTKIRQVVMGTTAAVVGIRKDDLIKSVDGQRVLTYGDFTRVLELAPEKGTVTIQVERNGNSIDYRIPLSPGWRKSPDPSWRPSTGIVGPNTGFWGKPLTAKEQAQQKLSDSDLALKVVVVWGDWAKKAGVRNGDIVIELDGINVRKNIKQLQTHLQLNREFGNQIELAVLRNGKRQDLSMKLPDEIDE